MKKFDKMLMSKRIRSCRKLKKLSQRELADILGMLQNNISNYEGGRVIPPSNVLFEMAELFSVSADYLLGREADNSSSSLMVKNATLQKTLSDIELIIKRENS